MNNFEQLNINKEQEEDLKINLDREIGDFVEINENDIDNINKDINNILGSASLDNTIKYYAFSNKESFERLKENKISSPDSAFFYIDSKTQEKTVFDYTPIPSKEEILKGEAYGYDLNERKKMVKADILSSFAHETAHMHQFFEKHGNDGTANLWEQEQICVYIGEKIRGDISDILISKGLLKDEAIDSFDLSDGEWNNHKKDKDVVINFFYPFLVKEYGLDKIRNFWKSLQKDPDIEIAIENTLNQKPKEVVADFKKKIKSRDYLRDIFS